MTSLQVIFGLPPPPIKYPGYAYAWGMASGPWLGGSGAPLPKTQEGAPSETLIFAHFGNRLK